MNEGLTSGRGGRYRIPNGTSPAKVGRQQDTSATGVLVANYHCGRPQHIEGPSRPGAEVDVRRVQAGRLFRMLLEKVLSLRTVHAAPAPISKSTGCPCVRP